MIEDSVVVGDDHGIAQSLCRLHRLVAQTPPSMQVSYHDAHGIASKLSPRGRAPHPEKTQGEDISELKQVSLQDIAVICEQTQVTV